MTAAHDGARGGLRARMRREAFLTTPLSLPYHSGYIVRRGLHRVLAPRLATLRGDVLDFGCGSKPYELLFSSAASYTGVDIAVSGHDHRDSRVDVFYDGKILPFKTGRYPVVVAFEVFEHVFDIQSTLAEINRVLQPSGTLIFTIPFAWPEHETPFDFARYTSFGIRDVLDRGGFDVVEIVKSNGSVLAIAQLAINYWDTNILIPLGLVGKALRLVTVGPANLLAIGLAAVLPKGDALFSNLVVTARRREAKSGHG